MKKIITTLLCLLLLCGLFAETGYDGVRWYSPIKTLDNAWDSGKGAIVVPEVCTILGNTSIKSFVYEKNKLVGVGYCITEEQVAELLSRLEEKKKVYEINTSFITDSLTSSTFRLSIQKNNVPSFYDAEKKTTSYLFYSMIGDYYSVKKANEIESEGYKNLKEAKKKDAGYCTLYIYDYNDDTRIYITSGNAEGLAFVSYVPHIKDY